MLQWDAPIIHSIDKTNANDSGWGRHYAALLKYGEEYGTYNIPKKDSFDCVLPGMGEDGGDFHYRNKLGSWLCTQRQARKGTLGTHKLTPEREALLQQLVDEG